MAYKRFLSGKTQESDKEKIARLERENAELTQRLKDVGNLLEPGKLADYMKKNNGMLHHGFNNTIALYFPREGGGLIFFGQSRGKRYN